VDIEEVEVFFERVFGRPSINRSKLYSKPDPKFPSYPTDYCTFTPIADLFFDSIDPKKYVIDGEQRYDSISESHLNGTGWGVVEGIDEIYETLVANGIHSTDQANRPADPKSAPVASFNDAKLFYTLASDSGLRYEFYPSSYIRSIDPRTDSNWKLPPVSKSDPLGIEFCSHHTILTDNVDRQLKLLVDILGGRVIHKGRNELLGTDSTYVNLAESVFEIAVPTVAGSYAMEDWLKTKPQDTYHAISFKVRDLDKVEKQLEATGVRLLVKNKTGLITNPKDSIGIPWGFYSTAVPGDLRRND